MFAEQHGVVIKEILMSATFERITIINFGMGSPNAATAMDLLTAIKPRAALFLGKCGGLRHDKNKRGDYILPIAAIRGEGTSNDYLPPEVPALPAFALRKPFRRLSAISKGITGPVPSIRPTAGYGQNIGNNLQQYLRGYPSYGY